MRRWKLLNYGAVTGLAIIVLVAVLQIIDALSESDEKPTETTLPLIFGLKRDAITRSVLLNVCADEAPQPECREQSSPTNPSSTPQASAGTAPGDLERPRVLSVAVDADLRKDDGRSQFPANQITAPQRTSEIRVSSLPSPLIQANLNKYRQVAIAV